MFELRDTLFLSAPVVGMMLWKESQRRRGVAPEEIVELTGPWWRLASVTALLGGIVALGATGGTEFIYFQF